MFKDISKYYLFLLGFLFCLILLFLKVGFSLWLWIYLILILIFGFLFYFKQSLLILSYWLYIFIFLIVFGLLLTVSLPKSGVGGSNTPKMSKEECEANAQLYNGKVLRLEGEGLKGMAEVVANTEKCRLEVYYVIYFNTGLSPNAYDVNTWKYNYAGLMKKDSIKERKYYRSTGVLTIVEANAGKLPESAKDFQATSLFYRPKSTTAWNDLETTHFYNSFSVYQDLTDAGYRDLFNYNWFGIVDLRPYTSKKETGNGGFEYVTDTEQADINGNIVKEFKFTISE